ncbi:MAG: methyltransferase domain-containing protein [Rhodospirillales bacterium]
MGDAFCALRSARTRRDDGATYTPAAIVGAMLDWAVRSGAPARIVDPGCGSGRFVVAAARRFPDAKLIAVDTDPLAVLMTRAAAAAHGVAHRLDARCLDYRDLALPDIAAPTLFVGNPPYVRHHGIDARWKDWLAETARRHGLSASRLAGLHVHFFLHTRALGRPGDFGAFVTAAEWLDVNYGALLRALLADGLGGVAIDVVAPSARPFADAMTSAAIACFRIGDRAPALAVRAVDSPERIGTVGSGRPVAWDALVSTPRWSGFVRAAPKPPAGLVELGELCRVHRGQVTGANKVWIAGAYGGALPPRLLRPTVTHARELFAAGPALIADAALQRVIDLPVELDALAAAERRQVERFLAWARAQGAHEAFVARHRRAWWAVGLHAQAPILCSYMARRPPAFVRNLCGARHLNIAHGLYPRAAMDDDVLAALAAWLSAHVDGAAGRTYAGGLVKFEPREVERIPVPPPDALPPALSCPPAPNCR